MSECPGAALDLGKPRHTRPPDVSPEYDEKGSPAVEPPRCTATTAAGERCKRPATRGAVCSSHVDWTAEARRLLDADAPDPFAVAADLLDPPAEAGS